MFDLIKNMNTSEQQSHLICDHICIIYVYTYTYVHSYNGLTYIARKSIEIIFNIYSICVNYDDLKFSDLCFEMIE